MLDHEIFTPDGVADWLAESAGEYVGMAASELERTVPLAEYGMDSASAVGLCGDIELKFHIVVDPTLVYDYPTINDMATFITSQSPPVTTAAESRPA